MIDKPVRIKLIRRQEEQSRKVKELMEMFKLSPSSGYEIMGGSSLTGELAKVRELMQMFHLDR